LCLRQQQPDIFQKGEYLPLSVRCAKSERAVAFARKHGNTIGIVAAPRLISGLLNDVDLAPTGAQIWEDTQLQLPRQAIGKQLKNVFKGETADSEAEILVSKVLGRIPGSDLAERLNVIVVPTPFFSPLIAGTGTPD